MDPLSTNDSSLVDFNWMPSSHGPINFSDHTDFPSWAQWPPRLDQCLPTEDSCMLSMTGHIPQLGLGWCEWPLVDDVAFSSCADEPWAGHLTCLPDSSEKIDSPVCTPFPRASEQRVSPQRFCCDWPRCSALSPFKTLQDWKAHTKLHGREIRHDWTPGRQCSWYGCPSKARFKTARLYERHIENIHINPLICTIDSCEHKRPFRSNADLQRHISTIHDEKPRFWCPFEICELGKKSFSRKDKWIYHLRTLHKNEPCPYNHCQNPIAPLPGTESDLACHISKEHGGFECALNGCQETTSRFSESALLEHLQLRHNISWEIVSKIRGKARDHIDHTVREEFIPFNHI